MDGRGRPSLGCELTHTRLTRFINLADEGARYHHVVAGPEKLVSRVDVKLRFPVFCLAAGRRSQRPRYRCVSSRSNIWPSVSLASLFLSRPVALFFTLTVRLLVSGSCATPPRLCRMTLSQGAAHQETRTRTSFVVSLSPREGCCRYWNPKARRSVPSQRDSFVVFMNEYRCWMTIISFDELTGGQTSDETEGPIDTDEYSFHTRTRIVLSSPVPSDPRA